MVGIGTVNQAGELIEYAGRGAGLALGLEMKTEWKGMERNWIDRWSEMT
jgi:hypothetical protein